MALAILPDPNSQVLLHVSRLHLLLNPNTVSLTTNPTLGLLCGIHTKSMMLVILLLIARSNFFLKTLSIYYLIIEIKHFPHLRLSTNKRKFSPGK